MKKSYLYILVSAAVLLTSCQDWLKTGADTDVPGDDLFETESGFKDALIGCYIGMASDDLYAKNLTWHFLDILAQPYNSVSSLSDAFYIQQYLYKRAEVSKITDKIWLGAYKIIAEINNELKYLEENKAVLRPRVHDLIKGELLGLRASLHLDLMRLYGYGNLQNRAKLATMLTVPYVTIYSRELTEQRTYGETLTLIQKDLADAAVLLADDPIRNLHKDDASYYNGINEDGFFSNRKLRMNYYAVKALQARAYMWEGSEASQQLAFDIASELTAKEGDVYSWVKDGDIANSNPAEKNMTFTSEHLFTLEVYNLTDRINKYLVLPGAGESRHTCMFGGWNAETFTFDALRPEGWVYAPNHPDADPSDGTIYVDAESAGPGVSDYRFHYQLNQGSQESETIYVPIKLRQPDKYNILYKNRIPMIKITEMYYIMAEYYLNRNNEGEALNILNMIRSHRGIETPIDKDYMVNPGIELTKEYMREFFQEGQLFYYFKRLGLDDPTFNEGSGGYYGISEYTFDDKKFLIPYPDTEMQLGNRVQEYKE